MSKRTQQPISREEAQRAIFLDFEGPGKARRCDPDPAPILGGVLVEGTYEWTILDEQFRDARCKGIEADLLRLPDYLEGLMKRAQSENRRIVYWASHEASLFAQHGISLAGVGFDLKIPVKPHFKRLFSESRTAQKELFKAKTPSRRRAVRQKAFALCVQCAETFGLNIPTTYGKGKVGEYIRNVRDGSKGRDGYRHWPMAAKKRWSWLVAHNELDCRAMEMLMHKLEVYHA